jgi:hypothetical protein
MFSGDVNEVGKTKIFGRITAEEKKASQYLVYSMNVDTSAEVAMILPLPVARPCDSIEFIDLSKHAEFFSDLEGLFPRMRGFSKGFESDHFSDSLSVQRVGNFDASFVPTLADMSRLDKRFNLPKDVWDGLPQYADYAFAVFKLSAGESEFHPMALKFPTKFRDQVYFPTVHVHHGQIEEVERYDHTLYCQGHGDNFWTSGGAPEAGHKLLKLPAGIVLKGVIVKKLDVGGFRTNTDTYATKQGQKPKAYPVVVG